jgi:hypothetical protein
MRPHVSPPPQSHHLLSAHLCRVLSLGRDWLLFLLTSWPGNSPSPTPSTCSIASAARRSRQACHGAGVNPSVPFPEELIPLWESILTKPAPSACIYHGYLPRYLVARQLTLALPHWREVEAVLEEDVPWLLSVSRHLGFSGGSYTTSLGIHRHARSGTYGKLR